MPTVQSTTHSRRVSAAIRLNRQLVLLMVRNCSRRSELELRGPENGLTNGHRSSRGVRSAPLVGGAF
eukprot:2788167-Alexandrium_andersonii.AAC.1